VKRRPRALGWTLAGAILALLCMAPTAGDVGGCGTEVTALDPRAFALARKDEDCNRCRECDLRSPRCGRACDPTKDVDTSIPPTCQPIRHDGEVCLRALRSASCDAYASYVDDVAPATPSECEFCKVAPPSGSVPGFVLDGAAGDGAP
jgi:hypothetical protein